MKKVRVKLPSSIERVELLIRARNVKMARSAHAYVRGNTAKFYEWLDSTARKNVPDGPPIWICGDCHAGNLGPIASAKGHTEIQIRDLDQTVIGNPAHDLVRLGLSLASAARGSDLPGVTTARMIEALIEGYEEAFMARKEGKNIEILQPKAVKSAMRDALRRKWRHLARERIEDTSPEIPLGSRFWPISKSERSEIERLFSEDMVSRLVTSLRWRDDDAKVNVVDAAYWVKGCSSLGRLRFAVLLKVGGNDGELCLVDVKEATLPLAPRRARAKMPKDNAERVMSGACHVSPALGGRMLTGRLGDRAVFMRELLPQDLKFEIEHLTTAEAVKVARFLAAVVGKAHARQMDDGTLEGWQKELGRNRSKTLDAPSWLWSSVVELVVFHEGAYLEHCRKYALLSE